MCKALRSRVYAAESASTVPKTPYELKNWAQNAQKGAPGRGRGLPPLLRPYHSTPIRCCLEPARPVLLRLPA